MDGVRSFLFARVLTGLFAALARLLLPERFSSLGRLMKALCALFAATLILAPFLGAITDLESALNEWESRFIDKAAQVEEGDATRLVEREAASMIEENLKAYLAKEAPDLSFTVEFYTEEGINGAGVLISYEREDFPRQSASEYLSRVYGLRCRFSESGSEET